MAVERSIDGGNQQGRLRSKEIGSKEIRGEETTRGGAVVWFLARLAAMAALCGRVAQTSFARMRSAQARGENASR